MVRKVLQVRDEPSSRLAAVYSRDSRDEARGPVYQPLYGDSSVADCGLASCDGTGK